MIVLTLCCLCQCTSGRQNLACSPSFLAPLHHFFVPHLSPWLSSSGTPSPAPRLASLPPPVPERLQSFLTDWFLSRPATDNTDKQQGVCLRTNLAGFPMGPLANTQNDKVLWALKLWQKTLPWVEAERPPRTACSPQSQCRDSPPETALWGGCCVAKTRRCSNSQQSSQSGPASEGSHNLNRESSNYSMFTYLQAQVCLSVYY